MNRGAKIAGWIYFPIHVVVLPLFLGTALYLIAGTMPSDITCNIWYYAIGLAFTLVAMWKFLRQSYENMLNRFAYSFAMILAAYAVDLLLSLVLQLFMTFLGELPVPNNDTILDLAGQNYRRMFAVAVFMAPLVEECLFRGVIFRNLYSKSPWAAYLISMLAFALIHIVGFLGSYSPVDILLCMLQYLPAGLCLAWSCIRGQTIFSPIVIHALVNAVGIYRLR